MAKPTRRADHPNSASVNTTTANRQPIDYRVSMPDPGTHEYRVEMRVPALAERTAAIIVFPAWAPGSYMIRDFVRHVYRLTVTDERGRALPCERLDKQRWRVATGGAAFIVRHRVFAFEATVRTSFLDESHAYWNGSSLFFAVDGEHNRRCRVEVDAPPGWHISTALPRVQRSGARGRGASAAGAGSARFLAADYDELLDSPFEVGVHQLSRFRVGRTSFELALYGRTNADPRRLLDILRRVVRATGAIFGGFPFERYVFIVHALPVGSGGLEHKSSVTMDIAGLSFEDETAYHRFADLAAHEFFHVWNVKRLHDPVLGPFDYTKENYTRMLWFHEGFTDYLANVIILRAGIITEQDFWRWIGEDWPKYATRPGRNETSLDELSFEAWVKQYRPAENHFNRAVSYYEKGLWVGMALDIQLRLASGGRRGLPELFRRIWDRVGRREAAVTETDVRDAARAIAGRTGAGARGWGARGSIDAFFDKFIHGTDELPLPALLRRAGLDVTFTAPWARNGGEGDPVKRARARGWSGAVVQAQAHAIDGARALVKNVLPGSPAALAGLTFGDEIVAVDGDRVNAATFARRLSDHAPATTIGISYFRRDQLRETRLVVTTSPERKLAVVPMARPTPSARSVRRGWLGLSGRG